MEKEEYMTPEELMLWAKENADIYNHYLSVLEPMPEEEENGAECASTADAIQRLKQVMFETILTAAAYNVYEKYGDPAGYPDEEMAAAIGDEVYRVLVGLTEQTHHENPLFPVDRDGLTALFANKGAHALMQARYDKFQTTKKEETGKEFFTHGHAGTTHIKKFQKAVGAPFAGLNPVAVKMINISHAQLREQNQHHRVTPETANRFVTIPLTQWMDACDLTDKKAAKRQLQAASDLLLGIRLYVDDSCIYEERGADNKYHRKKVKLPAAGINVLGGREWLDPQTFRLEYTGMYVTYLADTHIEYFPLQHILKLDSNKEALTVQIVEVIYARWNTNRMKKAERGLNPNLVTVSVRHLIERCPALPLEEELTKGQKKNKTRTYYVRIVGALDKLVSDGLINSWQFCHGRGKPLLPTENPKTWSLFKTLYIRVEIDAERQKEIAIESTQKQKKRKAAAAAKKEN